VGFRFRLIRYSRNLLSSCDATPFFVLETTSEIRVFLEEEFMMKNFLVQQNQGSRTVISCPETGINVCRKWDVFWRNGETAKRRNGERAKGRVGEKTRSPCGSCRFIPS
jgi:hypothetical protein